MSGPLSVAIRQIEPPRRFDAADRDPGLDLAPARDEPLGERAREFGGIAGFVGRAVESADNLASFGAEGRVERVDPLPVEHFNLLSVGLEELHPRDARVERALRTMIIENAALVAIVFDRLVAERALKHLLRIDGQAMLEQRVAARFLRHAFAHEERRPIIETGIGGEPETQRLILQEERLQQDHRRLGRRPGKRMARRDHAGVAPTRSRRGQAVALDDRDFVAVPLQLVGRRHADNAASHDKDAHGSPIPP